MAGKLEIDPDGRVTGPVTITYNDPFPTRNGAWGSGAMMGVVMHTMVGNLQPATVDLFNNPAAAVSAHFGIAQDGSVWQFGPIGKGWIAWAEMAGNHAWYSIEHADDGDTENPLTDAQLTVGLAFNEVRWSVSTYKRYLETMVGWADELALAADQLEVCIFSTQARSGNTQWAFS